MNPRSRFIVAYVVVIAFFFSLIVNLGIGLVSHRTRTLTGWKPISNSSSPFQVERAFKKGAEFNQTPASNLDLRDGTCYIYTNTVSWVVFECFGAVQK